MGIICSNCVNMKNASKDNYIEMYESENYEDYVIKKSETKKSRPLHIEKRINILDNMNITVGQFKQQSSCFGKYDDSCLFGGSEKIKSKYNKSDLEYDFKNDNLILSSFFSSC
jgi:hypothetical protein